jgi:hypothetical protein
MPPGAHRSERPSGYPELSAEALAVIEVGDNLQRKDLTTADDMSAQSEKRQDGEDDHDEPDEIDNIIHRLPFRVGVWEAACPRRTALPSLMRALSGHRPADATWRQTGAP